MTGTTTILYGETIQGKAALPDWNVLYKACEQFHRFKIEITDRDAINISDEQRGWIHCDNGPVRKIMKSEKKTFPDAKIFCKVRFARSLFVKIITSENCDKINGTPYFECLTCLEIFHVAKLNYEDGERCCPECGSRDLQLIAIASSESLSVKKISWWMQEMIDKLRLQEPDAEWWENEKEKLRKTANAPK